MKKSLKRFISFSYLVILGYLVFFQGGRDQIKNHPFNLVPIRNKLVDFIYLNWHDLRYTLRFYGNLIGNVVLFIPFPLVVMWLFPKLSGKRVFLGGLVTSVFIETTQYFFERGVADIDDVLLNFSGSVIGLMLIRLHRRSNFTETLFYI